MKLSIIMPVYNCAKTLKDSISSVLNQTYHNFNFIIVDDDSTDETRDICNGYALQDTRIKVINQQNAGPSAARNKGFDNVRTEYVMFIDGDDTYERTMVETMITAIEETPVDLVVCGINRVFISGKREKLNSICFDSDYTFISKADILDNIDVLLQSGLFNSLTNKLYKTSTIRDNNMYMDVKLDIGEDLQFNLVYIEHVNSVRVIKHALYNYYVSNSYLTNKFRENIFDIRKVPLENLRNFYMRNGIVCDLNDFLYIKLAFACFMQLFHKDNPKTKYEDYKYIKSIISSSEVMGALMKIRPKGAFQIVLVIILKTKSLTFIYMIAKLMVIVRNKNIINFKRISV